MIKLICGGVVCVCLGYIGLGIKNYYKARLKFFEEFYAFIEVLIAEISYTKPPVIDIINGFLLTHKGEFPNILTKFKEQVAKGIIGRDIQLSSAILNKNEKELMLEVFRDFGRFDSDTQLKNLSNYKQKIKGLLDDTSSKFKTNGNLAFKLMVLLGVVVLIIVV